MYRGRYQLGQTVPIAVQCKNASDVPADPTACPRYEVLNSSGQKIVSGALPIADPPATTGFFLGGLYLNSSFAAGQYTIHYRWDISGSRFEKIDTFEIPPGGDAAGTAIAMHNYERPQANFLVNQRQDGAFYKGKNPRV